MKDLGDAKALAEAVLALDPAERMTVATFAAAYTLMADTLTEDYDEFWQHFQAMVRETMQDMVMEAMGLPLDEETKH